MTQAFNLSQLANFVNTSGQLNAATGLYNQVPIANGGTGRSSVTSGALLIGAGASAMTELAGTTPGRVVVSSPTGWTSSPGPSAAGGNYIMRIYTSPSPWTKDPELKSVKVTIISGGAGGTGAKGPANTASGGGGGAYGFGYLPAPAIPGPLTVTVGSGGTGGVAPTALNAQFGCGTPGGTSSFGAFISATGGGVSGPGGSGPGPALFPSGLGGVITPSPTIYGSNGLRGGVGIGQGPRDGGMSGQFGTWGQGGVAGAVGPAAGGAGSGFGGGGGGGFGAPTTSGPGGNGSPGYVIVEEFY